MSDVVRERQAFAPSQKKIGIRLFFVVRFAVGIGICIWVFCFFLGQGYRHHLWYSSKC